MEDNVDLHVNNIANVVRRVVREMGITPPLTSASAATTTSRSATPPRPLPAPRGAGHGPGTTRRPPQPQAEAATTAVPLPAAHGPTSTSMTTVQQSRVHQQPQCSYWPAPSIARRKSRGRGRSLPLTRKPVSKDILCLPFTDAQFMGIPRGKARQKLAEAGYAGKISLWRGQTPEEVREEVSSVFEGITGGGLLEFEFLSIIPGTGKKLQRPKVSQNFSWGGTEVLAGQGQGGMYVMMASQYGITYEEFFAEDDDLDRKRPRRESEEESSDDELESVSLHTTPRKPTQETRRHSLPSGSENAQPAQSTQLTRRHSLPSRSGNVQPSSEVASTSYEAYVDLVDVDIADTDNVTASCQEELLEEYVPATMYTDENMLQTDLDAWKEQQVTGDEAPNHLYVRRKHLLADTLKGFREGAMEAHKSLCVSFVGETGVDTGGLTRELFSLVLPKIRDSGIFVGYHGRMLPANNSAGIANGELKKVGRLLAAAVLHGRTRLEFVNPIIGQLLCSGEPSHLAINLLPEVPVQDLIKRMKAAVDDGSLNEILDEGDVLQEIGWRKLVTMDNRNEVVQAICYHHLMNKQKGEIDALIQGMEFWGIKKFAEAHPACIHAIFRKKTSLDPNEVFGIFSIEYSEEGSNDKEDEERTTMFLIEFLQKCDSKDPDVEGVTLEDFFQFFCGARCIPLGGFDLVPTIKFHNNRLPHVSTCSLELRINRKCAGVEAFIKDMVFGIKNSPGFGQV